MKTDFDYNSMPVSFAHCLNGHCLRADKCLRRQVTLRMPKERAAVMVINPEHVTSDGVDCTYFIDEKPVLFARGMKHLLDRVPLADATVIKRQMIAYLSLIHISEPTRRTPISYAVFCLKKKKNEKQKCKPGL